MRRLPELQAALASPVPSIRTPFTREGAVDFVGLQRYVGACLDHGAKALMLTFGDSLLSLLDDDELLAVTRAVTEQAKGRAKVIGAERMCWTGKAVAWAKKCRQLGVDILMVLPPDWAHSGTVASLTSHYAAVAGEIPVMLVTAFLAPREKEFRLDLIRSVYENVPQAVSVKDDVGGEFGLAMTQIVQDRWTVIAGGTKQLHAHLAPAGCRGHLSTLIVYKPEIAWRYWRAFTSGDQADAAAVVRDFDVPMFAAIGKSPGSFDAAMHAWGELCGIYGRWRRSPYYTMNDAEVAKLRADLQRVGLL